MNTQLEFFFKKKTEIRIYNDLIRKTVYKIVSCIDRPTWRVVGTLVDSQLFGSKI